MKVSDALWIFLNMTRGRKKNQPSMFQSGGESEGAKSYGVCLFLVSGSKEISSVRVRVGARGGRNVRNDPFMRRFQADDLRVKYARN